MPGKAPSSIIEEARLTVDREVIWHSFVRLRQGLMAGGLAGFYDDPAKSGRLKPEAVWEIEAGNRLSAMDLYAASVQRSAVYQAFRTSVGSMTSWPCRARRCSPSMPGSIGRRRSPA